MKRKVGIVAMAKRLGFEEELSKRKGVYYRKPMSVTDLDGDIHTYDIELVPYEGSYIVLLGPQFIGRTDNATVLSCLVRSFERIAGNHVRHKLRLTPSLP